MALSAADSCGVVDIYPARERVTSRVSTGTWLPPRRLMPPAAEVAWMRTLDDARRWLEATLRPGDLCLLMGAGDIDSLGRALDRHGLNRDHSHGPPRMCRKRHAM